MFNFYKTDIQQNMEISQDWESMLPEVLRLEGLAVEQPGGREGQPSLGPLCVALEAPSFKGGDADAFLLFSKMIKK